MTRLRRLDEVKTGLISTVSHELKTPLTSIRLAIHVLLNEKLGPLSPRQIELLATARQDSDRLYRVIEDLLDISRMESGGAEIQFSRSMSRTWSCRRRIKCDRPSWTKRSR